MSCGVTGTRTPVTASELSSPGLFFSVLLLVFAHPALGGEERRRAGLLGTALANRTELRRSLHVDALHGSRPIVKERRFICSMIRSATCCGVVPEVGGSSGTVPATVGATTPPTEGEFSWPTS